LNGRWAISSCVAEKRLRVPPLLLLSDPLPTLGPRGAHQVPHGIKQYSVRYDHLSLLGAVAGKYVSGFCKGSNKLITRDILAIFARLTPVMGPGVTEVFTMLGRFSSSRKVLGSFQFILRLIIQLQHFDRKTWGMEAWQCLVSVN